MSLDFQARLDNAKKALPLKRLMEQHGDGPSGSGNWKSYRCPFCDHKSGAGVFEQDGQEWFKCFHDSCPSGTSAAGSAWEQVAYLQYKLNLSHRTDAAIKLMEMTGEWKPSTPSPGIMPGSQRRRNPRPAPEVEKPKKPEPEDETAEAQRRRAEDVSISSASDEMEKTDMPALEEVPEVEGGAPSTAPGAGALPADGSSELEGGAPPIAPEAGALPGKEVDAPVSIEEEPKSLREMGLECLRAFYAQLTLSAADEQMLWTKRGLTPETCAALGYKSNGAETKKLLLALAEKFDEDVLLDSGLWQEKDGRLSPNAQFYGFGMVGKKPRAERDPKRPKDKFIWDWKESGKCNPILIPYFDEAGELVSLRPHKGGMAGRGAQFYVVRRAGQKEERCRTAIITEGEFKGAALKQVLTHGGGRVAVGVMPGIQQAKNWEVLEQLKAWLNDIGAESVVVAYDNEEKSDPALPGFQPDKKKRYEAEKWARYLATILNREWAARVCIIPKAWRDAKGKADWDGALASQVRSEKVEGRSKKEFDAGGGAEPGKPSDASPGGLLGEGAGPPASFLWPKVAKSIQKLWTRVIAEARAPKEFAQGALFDSEAEEIIQNGLTQLFYVKALEHGSEKELAWAKKLRKLARGPLREEWGVHEMADAFHDTYGWYYKCNPPQLKERIALNVRRIEARKERQHELAWFLQMMVNGFPKRVGNFRMSCKYTLVRADGGRDRLVFIRNNNGETTEALVPMDSRSETAPRDFRIFLRDCGNFIWKAGERELQDLQQDLAHESHNRHVYQVVSYGTHEETGLWFWDDVAFDTTGKEIQPDEDGIFWWTDAFGAHHGFKFKRKAGKPVGGEDQEFRPPPPKMQPGMELRFGKEVRRDAAPAGETPAIPGEGKFWLEKAGENGHAVTEDVAAIRELFLKLSHALFETLGGHDGFVGIGSMLAYFHAPELFKKWQAFPGLMVVGELGSGKNTLCGMLVQLAGFPDAGCNRSLPATTAVGMQISGEQYANLPVWFDEHDDNVLDIHKKEIIHESYNRGMPGKWAPSGQMRRARTAFLVSGETTASRGATRSRFPHIEVSASKRRGDHLPWLEQHREFFFSIGRFVMRRRKEFCELMQTHLEHWRKTPALARVEDRSRFVNGVPYAAYMALAQILDAAPAELGTFMVAQQATCVRAAGEVRLQVNVNEFWQDVYSGWQNGAFGDIPSEWKKFFFALRKDSSTHPPGCPNQIEYHGWETIYLYFKPAVVLDALRAWKRRSGREMPLSQNDLLRQMQTRPYWVEFPSYGAHKQRFYGSDRSESAWAINLDRHEMGYRAMSDAEWQKVIYKDPKAQIYYPSDEWDDPRKGDLFALVRALMKGGDDPDQGKL